jgi:hypothetical protein
MQRERSKRMTTFPSKVKQPVPFASDAKLRRHHRNRLLIIVGSAILLIAIVTSGLVVAYTSATYQVSRPVEQYYAAIQNQQYAEATSHLDTPFTYKLAVISDENYIQIATKLDANEGKVMNYSITSVNWIWYFGINEGRAMVHVTRPDRSYEVELMLRQEGNTYKITDIDDI